MLRLQVIPFALRQGLAVLVNSLAPVRPWNKAGLIVGSVECSEVCGEGEEEEDEVEGNEGDG